MKRTKGKPLFDAHQFLTKFGEHYRSDLASLNTPYHLYCAERYLSQYSKKYLLSGDLLARKNKAYAKFLQVNDEMKAYLTFISPSDDDPSSRVIRMASRLIRFALGAAPTALEWFEKTKNSQGSSIGVSYQDTSPEAKFRFPISSTKEVVPLWQAYKKYDQTLWSAICELNIATPDSGGDVDVVAGSRSCTVPKTTDIDRMIAVEPVLNMFFQHGLLAHMRERLEKQGLSFTRDPELHRKLAYEGSIHNGYATIDFSSMSDRVSLGVAKALLPEDWHHLLMLVRCKTMSIDGVEHELNMISTMGNATTFPLETLVLWAVAMCSVQITIDPTLSEIPDLRKKPWKSLVRVFGDDCILPSTAVELFLKSCRRLGFVPNDDKSFFGNEFFRESCGGDFYHGRDVRPFYLGVLPQSVNKKEYEAYLYRTINGVLRTYIKYFGVLTYIYEKSLIAFLFSCLKQVTDQVKFVPENFPDDSGITFLRDSGRIRLCYPIPLSRVVVNQHGQMYFNYLAYKFSIKKETCQDLRYAIALKTLEHYAPQPLFPERSENEADRYSVRRRGKYVQCTCKFDTTIKTPTNQQLPWSFLDILITQNQIEDLRYLLASKFHGD